MNLSEPKVSIIVPVYNVEDYLVQCVDSLINQTYRNLQIILIDDGSTDNSGAICDKYKKTAPTNRGCFPARLMEIYAYRHKNLIYQSR